MTSEKENNKILGEILEIKDTLRDLSSKISNMEKDLRNEMALKHQAIDFQLQNHDHDLSNQKKIVFYIAAAIGTALIGAFMKVILKI